MKNLGSITLRNQWHIISAEPCSSTLPGATKSRSLPNASPWPHFLVSTKVYAFSYATSQFPRFNVPLNCLIAIRFACLTVTLYQQREVSLPLICRHCCGHDFGEAARVEASPSNQGTIDIGLEEEFASIVRRDASPVEDAGFCGDFRS